MRSEADVALTRHRTPEARSGPQDPQVAQGRDVPGLLLCAVVLLGALYATVGASPIWSLRNKNSHAIVEYSCGSQGL